MGRGLGSPRTAAEVAELRREVEQITWYHRIDLGDGVVTPGKYDPRPVLHRIGLPADLTGRSVLDVGAYDGFFSFEAERRGADRVVATDWYEWGGPGGGSQRGFEVARRALSSHVQDVEVDVPDLSPDRLGTFDLVLFLGVLYHLRDPVSALERVAAMSQRELIVEGVCSLMWLPVPAARLFPGRWLDGEESNWWALNTAAVAGLLRSFGFTDVRLHARTPRREIWRYAIGMWRRGNGALLMRLAQQRATFHARR